MDTISQYNKDTDDHLAAKSKISKEIEHGTLYEIYFYRFAADNYAVFNEDEKLVRVECHPNDRSRAKAYVKKNLNEFLEQVRQMKIPKGISYEPTNEANPDEFDFP